MDRRNGVHCRAQRGVSLIEMPQEFFRRGRHSGKIADPPGHCLG
jgi:hypothetical protein